MTALPVGDTLYGIARPNWLSNVGVETVTSNMEFITITTNIDIRPYAAAITASQTIAQATQSQLNLNKLLEIVSLRGQPVIMGAVTGTTRLAIVLVTEHAGAWSNASSPNDLKSRIIADGVNFGFGIDNSGDTPAGPNDSSGGSGGGLTVAFNSPQVLT